MELKKRSFESQKAIFSRQYSVASTSKLNLYSKIKKVYRTEPYLLSNLSYEEKKAVAKCRISAHCFPIEFDRRRNVDRQNRLCKLCNMNLIGDEYHYIIKCNNSEIQSMRTE